MNTPTPEQHLKEQLAAEVQRGVRADLDLWPRLRREVAARPAARPWPVRLRPALLLALLAVLVGGGLWTIRPAMESLPFAAPQTVQRGSITERRGGDDRWAGGGTPLPGAPVGNAGSALDPFAGLVGQPATVTLTLNNAVAQPGALEAVFTVRVQSPGGRLDPLPWRPLVVLQPDTGGPSPTPLAGGGWRYQFVLPAGATGRAATLVVSALVVDGGAGSGQLLLPGPWIFRPFTP